MFQLFVFYREYLTLLTAMFRQKFAHKLDEWSRDGIFNQSPALIPFALLGIPGTAVQLSRLTSDQKIIEPEQFNKISRVFWEFKLLDNMVSLSCFNGSCNPKHRVPPSTDKLKELRSKGTVRRVSYYYHPPYTTQFKHPCRFWSTDWTTGWEMFAIL